MNKYLINSLVACILSFTGTYGYSQSEKIYNTFRGTRIINGHSVETPNQGEFEFVISHRFGEINGGPYELFGLDNSTIRFGLEYAILNNLMVGVGRSSFEKTYDAFLKYRFLEQRVDNSIPISAAWLSSMALKTINWPDPERENYFTSRMYYTHQLIVSRKFSERFALQVMPTLVHRNIVDSLNVQNDVLSVGAAMRYQLSKVIALYAEYYYVFPNHVAQQYYNSIGAGIDIETGGHNFQIHLTNSRGMIEKFFITETTGNAWNGDLHLGFNISRVFKIKGRNYHARQIQEQEIMEQTSSL